MNHDEICDGRWPISKTARHGERGGPVPNRKSQIANRQSSAAVALILVFVAIYILPLGVRPLVFPDETRYAEIPREMIETGDWIVPRLDGVRYFEKPVLGYWLNAWSIRAFGENAFAVRLPAALSVAFSALMIYWLVRRFGKGRSVAILAAGVFMTCLLVFCIGVFSVFDGPLAAFLTATLVTFFFAYETPTPFKRTLLLCLCGAFCGLAFLTKGFLAFAVPVLAVAAFLVWERRWKALLTMPWPVLVGAAVVALPWCLAIARREGDFWHYFFWVEHVARFSEAREGQHAEPFWHYLPILAGGALPWTALSGAAVLGLRRAGLKDPLVRFALCWLVLPLAFFSICSGKIATYILPCFAPLAILAAVGLTRYFEGPGRRAFALGAWISAAAAAAVALGLVVNQTTGAFGAKLFASGEVAKWVLVAAAFVAWAALSALAALARKPSAKLALFCATGLALMLALSFALPDRVRERKAPGAFLARHADRVRPDTILVSTNYLVSAVSWFYERDDVLILDRGGELQYGLDYEDARHRLLSVEELAEILQQDRGGRNVVFLTTRKRHEEYASHLPPPATEDVTPGFVLAEYSMGSGLKN